MSRAAELLDELDHGAHAACTNCSAPEQRAAIDRMCDGVCVECNNTRVPEIETFYTEHVQEAVRMGRELHAIYAEAVQCRSASDTLALVKTLIARAEAAGFTKDGRKLTKAGKTALDRFTKAVAS